MSCYASHHLHYQFPFDAVAPAVVTLSLLGTSLVAGEDTVLQCSAAIDPNVDRGIIVYIFTWQARNSNISILSGESRIFVTGFGSSLFTLSRLRAGETVVTCTVRLAKPENILDSSKPISMSITLNVLSKQTLVG